MSGFLSQLIAGALSPLVGFLLIANTRSLAKLAFLPFLISLVVFVVGLAFGLPFVTGLVAPFTQSFMNLIGSKSETLATLLPFLIWPSLALMLIFTLVNLTRLLASPLYGLLAEKVLVLQGVIEPEKRSLLAWAAVNARQSKGAGIKAVIFLLIGLVLGLLSFVPGVGLITSFAFLILLAYDVIDYALEALEWPLAKRVSFFRRHFAVFIGLGLSLGLVFLMPGPCFFVLPASVVGASDLVRRMIRE